LSDPDRSRKFGNEEKLMSLTEEEFEELEETFAYNDANNDGKIEYQEFVAMLDALEAGMKADEARVGFDEIDTDNDGSIELDEFIDWWRDG
jgi:Ca2+-binding EF-hand superfamily protein